MWKSHFFVTGATVAEVDNYVYNFFKTAGLSTLSTKHITAHCFVHSFHKQISAGEGSSPLQQISMPPLLKNRNPASKSAALAALKKGSGGEVPSGVWGLTMVCSLAPRS
jgi:hypothetical protein